MNAMQRDDATRSRWHAPIRARLAGRRVLVLGLGASGLAMAAWCARHGADVTVWDSRATPPGSDALAALAAEGLRIERIGGELDAARADGIALVLKSPGLAPTDARIAPLLQRARAAGTAIGGELALWAQAMATYAEACGWQPKVIAITGTNGKTTTTALTASLLERAGWRAVAAGNIGPTLLETLAEAIDAQAADDRPEGDAREAGDAVASARADNVPVDPAAEGSAAADADPAAAALEPPLADGSAASAAGVETSVVDASEADPVAEAAEAAPDAAPDAEPDAEPDAGAPRIQPPEPPKPTFAHLPHAWVLELSSFQLADAGDFEPDAAAVLNISQDHLDWHGDMASYVRAKDAVHGPADRLERAARAGAQALPRTMMVVNRDDPQVEALVPVPVPRKGQRGRTVSAQVVRFGVGQPQHLGDWGIAEAGGIAWLVHAVPDSDAAPARRRGASADEPGFLLQRLMPVDALRIRGRHNAANALAALALATAVGGPLAPMLHGLRAYRGEPHRVQFIGSVDGIDAYDDSKGTNVGATVAALQGLGQDIAPRRIAVILGGDGKGQDFTPLAAPLARHARAVALIGRDAPAIAQAVGDALARAGIAQQRFDTLEAATAWCFDQARRADALLLSPACASLDMFRDYAHRAEVFARAVAERAEARGTMLEGSA